MLNSGPVVRRTLLIIHTILVVFVLAGSPALAQSAGGEARVTAVEHQAAGDRIRVVVHFDRPVRFVEGTAIDPYRIFFDLQGTRPGESLPAKTASAPQRLSFSAFALGALVGR